MNKKLDSTKTVQEFFDLIESSTISLIKSTKKDALELSEKAERKSDSKIMKSADVTIEDIIKKVNYIRSGKSLNSKDIKASFEKYFSSLTKEERVALFTSLKGIAQIITGEIFGAEAITPKEPPANVLMKKVKDVSKAKEEDNKEIYKIDTKVVKDVSQEKEPEEEVEDIKPPVKAKD
jgi:hypothetical protein